MLCFPNAKINLGLHILNRREDGYHTIESIFYPIPYADSLELITIDGDEDEFVFFGKEIPGSLEGNLIYKALQVLREKHTIPTVKVILQKEMVMGGGIGGGSADGAFMLKLLNDTFSLGLGLDELKEYALKLGSDCPFFIDNLPAYVSGRGELLENYPAILKGMYFVLLAPGFHISTAEAYVRMVPNNSRKPLKDILQQDVATWQTSLQNDFEEVVFNKFPLLRSYKDELQSKEAIYTSLTGTGSCLYGLYTVKPALSKALQKLIVWEGYL